MSILDTMAAIGILGVMAFAMTACADDLLPTDPTPLERTVDSGDIEAIQLRIGEGADPNERREGVSLLTRAVWAGDPEVVKVLVDRGAVVHGDTRDGHGWLEATTELGDQTFPMADVLLEIGYSPCAEVNDGHPPSANLTDLAKTPAQQAIVERLSSVEKHCHGDGAS